MRTSSQTNTFIAIALLSLATIAYQLALMQLLSFSQWHHFAYMVISVALLGFGASGTFLSFFKDKLMANFDTLLPLFLFSTAVCMCCVTTISNTPAIRFDTYLLFSNLKHIGRLLATYLLFLLPFFFAALAIGMCFIKYSNQIGKIYFANLFGSGIGGIVAIAFMWIFPPEKLPAIIAVFPFVAGFVRWKSNPFMKISLWFSTILLAITNIYSPQFTPSEFKSISKTMLMPEAEIINQKSSPYGLLQVVSSPVLRYAPDLSLNYRKPVPVRKVVFSNGNWLGAVIPSPEKDSLTILNYTTTTLPYIIQTPLNALFLHSGTGENIALALSYHVKHIDAVESNAVLIQLLKKELLSESDSLLLHPSVHVYTQEPRTFLGTSKQNYDLIQLPVIGSFYGSSGLDAIQVEFNLTIEAFRNMWSKLSMDGMICISCWMDFPVRNPLKITSTLLELLKIEGLENPPQHIAAIRSWSEITFIVKKSPITSLETARIREFCDNMLFDPLLLPDIREEERAHYNELFDPYFFNAIDTLLYIDSDSFLENYPFRIKPATDHKPFFSQYLKIKEIPRLSSVYGNQSIPFFELGYIVVLLTFVQILLVSVILIILPLLFTKYKVVNKTWTLVYFGGIGIGYMFFEMVFIQQFTLYLGHPIYSAAAVISILLLASGAGSYFSTKVNFTNLSLLVIPATIACIFIVLTISLPSILKHSIAYPNWIKICLMTILTGIPGFIMGFPFPLALTKLSRINPKEVPWAWAINGYSSVISTTLVTIISVETGFFWVMIIAATAYGLASLVNIRTNRSF